MTSLWFETALLPDGWAQSVRVEMAEGLIARVETGVPATPEDERHAVAVPGLANVHSHGFQRGMAGLAEYRGASDDDFWSWREVMYRFLDHLNPDDVEAINAMAYVEMLEGGFTHVGEFHYLHNGIDGERYANPAEMAERVVAAAEKTGIGLTLLPVFYAHSDFGGLPPKHGQRRFLNDIDTFVKLLEACMSTIPSDAILGLAPHSLRAVTPNELHALIKLHPDGPVHIHAAEQVKEVEASIAFSGARPVEWLLDHAGIDARWCLIHATQMTEGETVALAKSGAVAGLCPVTEANLGDGIFKALQFLLEGGRIGIGTDSNILIGVADELRALEYSQRLPHRARNVLADDRIPSVGHRLYSASLSGGAQALGIRAGIANGRRADIVTLNAEHPSLYGRAGDQLLDSWIFAANNGCIDTVWRYGRKRVSSGRHIEADPITMRYKEVLKRVLQQ
ncbi:MAG: formimidoylglutamate deiminase [Pseudomonadota bacterium]